jgi:palmitoyltransferase ZDHHC6
MGMCPPTLIFLSADSLHLKLPDTHSGEGYEVKKLTGNPRFCRSCEKYKPARAHHCKVCDRCVFAIRFHLFSKPYYSIYRCVLRMGAQFYSVYISALQLTSPPLLDHHCPWINNCVGHFTYGHFIRFLFFVDCACSYHLAMVTRRVLDTMGTRYWDDPTAIELVFIILNYTLCIPVLLAVGAFRCVRGFYAHFRLSVEPDLIVWLFVRIGSLYHFYSLLGNSTTIEGWEKDKVATLVRRGKIREVSTYSSPTHLDPPVLIGLLSP